MSLPPGRDFFLYLSNFKGAELSILALTDDEMDLFDGSVQHNRPAEVISLLEVLRSDLMGHSEPLLTREFIQTFMNSYKGAQQVLAQQNKEMERLHSASSIGGGSVAAADADADGMSRQLSHMSVSEQQQRELQYYADRAGDLSQSGVGGAIDPPPVNSWDYVQPQGGNGGYGDDTIVTGVPLPHLPTAGGGGGGRPHRDNNSSVDNSDRRPSATSLQGFEEGDEAIAYNTSGYRPIEDGNPYGAGGYDYYGQQEGSGGNVQSITTDAADGYRPLATNPSYACEEGGSGGAAMHMPSHGVVMGVPMGERATAGGGGDFVVRGQPIWEGGRDGGADEALPLASLMPPTPTTQGTIAHEALYRYMKLKRQLLLSPSSAADHYSKKMKNGVDATDAGPTTGNADDNADNADRYNAVTIVGDGEGGGGPSSSSSSAPPPQLTKLTGSGSPFLDFYRGVSTVSSPDTNEQMDVMSLIALLPMVTDTEFPFLTTNAVANALFPLSVYGDSFSDNTMILHPVTAGELYYAKHDVTVRLRIVGLVECFVAAMGLEVINDGAHMLYFEKSNASSAQLAALSNPSEFRNCLRAATLVSALGHKGMAGGLWDYFRPKLIEYGLGEDGVRVIDATIQSGGGGVVDDYARFVGVPTRKAFSGSTALQLYNGGGQHDGDGGDDGCDAVGAHPAADFSDLIGSTDTVPAAAAVATQGSSGVVTFYDASATDGAVVDAVGPVADDYHVGGGGGGARNPFEAPGVLYSPVGVYSGGGGAAAEGGHYIASPTTEHQHYSAPFGSGSDGGAASASALGRVGDGYNAVDCDAVVASFIAEKVMRNDEAAATAAGASSTICFDEATVSEEEEPSSDGGEPPQHADDDTDNADVAPPSHAANNNSFGNHSTPAINPRRDGDNVSSDATHPLGAAVGDEEAPKAGAVVVGSSAAVVGEGVA